MARLLAAVPLCWLLLSHFYMEALTLFALASLTDAIDGYVAKRFHQETELGRYLDPLADKVLLMTAFITLSSIHLIPLWITLIIITRDLLLIGGVLFSKAMMDVWQVRPLSISKLNTFFQVVLILLILLKQGVPALETVVDVHIWATAVSTILSFGAYVAQWHFPVKWIQSIK